MIRSLDDGIYEIESVRFNMGGWWKFKLAIAGAGIFSVVPRDPTRQAASISNPCLTASFIPGFLDRFSSGPPSPQRLQNLARRARLAVVHSASLTTESPPLLQHHA
jgi:hypothetical protein